MNRLIVQKMLKIAEEFFGSASHPEYIPITMESMDKLMALSPNAMNVEIVNNEPVSWTVVIPTTKAVMTKFISGLITEKQLFNQTAPEQNHDALYLCSAFTVPQFRRQGLAEKLFKQSIELFSKDGAPELFAWPVTPEGKKMIEKFTKELGQTIITRK